MWRESVIATFGWVWLLLLSSAVHAEGWPAIQTNELIARSRYIGVGKLSISGKSDDGWLKGTLTFSEKLYSGIGDVKTYPVRIAPKTNPGTMQNWPDGKHGIWFILKTGDAFEPVNHPMCWQDETQAKAIANQIYAAAGKAYQEAKKAAQQSSTSSGTSDGSDSDKSVAAYAAMAAAAETTRNTPYQDKAKQSQQFYEQVMTMLETAGIKPPFGKDLADPAKQTEFFNQTKQMFGPAGAAMGDLPAQGDPARATKISAAQNNVGGLYLELVKNTMGSKNPSESLKTMGPINLETPGGAESPASAGKAPEATPGPGGIGGPAVGPKGFPGIGGPGGRAPAGGPSQSASPKPAQFQIPQANIPTGGSRKQMLGAMTNHTAGSNHSAPVGGPTGTPGPSPSPGGFPGGPKKPGGGAGGPGGPRPGPR